MSIATTLLIDLNVVKNDDGSLSMFFSSLTEYEASADQTARYFGIQSNMFTVTRDHRVEHENGKIEIKFRLKPKSHD